MSVLVFKHRIVIHGQTANDVEKIVFELERIFTGYNLSTSAITKNKNPTVPLGYFAVIYVYGRMGPNGRMSQ